MVAATGESIDWFIRKLPQGDVDSSRHPAIPTSVKACVVELSDTYPLLIEHLCKQMTAQSLSANRFRSVSAGVIPQKRPELAL